MNKTFSDAVEADLLTIERVVDVPDDAELGYGRDLSCVTDITDTCEEVDPQSPLGIAQRLCRRYITPRGGLPGDDDYGLDLRGICNRGVTYEELRELADQAQLEALKDDAVDHAEVTLDYDDVAAELTVNVQITPVDVAQGNFSFVFAVPDDAAPLLEAITITS